MAARRLRIQPANAVARRLEQIRKSLGFESFREYHIALNERSGGDDVHYNSAREYHVDRTVPVAYVGKVHEAFGASIDWIVSGEGEMWISGESNEPRRDLDFETHLERTAPEFSFAADVFASSLFRDVARRLFDACPDAREIGDADRARIFGVLSDLVLDPIRRFGADPTAELTRAYQVAMLSAVLHAIPERGRGRTARALLAEYDEKPSGYSPWASQRIVLDLEEDAREVGGGRFLFGADLEEGVLEIDPAAFSEEDETVPVESLSPPKGEEDEEEGEDPDEAPDDDPRDPPVGWH
jgi:hypothetical protein